MDPAAIAAWGGVASGVVAALTTLITTRSKSRIDDRATVIEQRDAARKELADKEVAWASEKAAIHEHHDAERNRLQARIDTLEEQVDEKNDALDAADRLVLAFRTYAARLVEMVVRLGGTPPDRPTDTH